MNPFTQGLLGAGICAVTFAAGIAVGAGRSSNSVTNNSRDSALDTREIRLVIPDKLTIDHHGLISDRAACLDWVSDHFKEPNVGQLAMICAGAKL